MFTNSKKTRFTAFVLAVVLLLSLFSGCAEEKDEALTVMIPLQKDSFCDFFEKFSEKNPDITFEKTSYRGGSPSAYILQRFEMNDLTDIVITSYPPEDNIQQDTLLDLSGYDFVQNYKAGVLSNLDVDGKIYLLDCPSSLRGIAYNKSLFAEKGWKAPTSHEEFTALLKQIKKEQNDIVPIEIQGKYPGTYFTLMSELAHCDFLQTPDGAEWKQSFAKGEATSKQGFGTGLELLQDWMDAGAFDSEQITVGDSIAYENLMNRECAMSYVMGSQNDLVELVEASDDEFGVFPIYGKGEDSEFVATTYGLKIGLNKKLGEPGNEKKLERALKLMEFLSTVEGQMVFHTGNGDILPLVGSSETLPEMFEQVSAVVERGHSAPFLYPGYEDILAPAGEYLRDACSKGGELTGVFDLMDKLRKDSINNKENYIASVSETLDERQTAQFIANTLNEQGYGDFALVSMGEFTDNFDVAGGANGKLYKGGIETVDVNLPLSNVASLNTVTMSLTGAQVRNLLNAGRVLTDEEGHTDSFEYFSAGLTVERDDNGKVKSATLDGADLADDKVYTVAFCPEDYSEDTAKIGNPKDTGVVWEEAYRTYITKLGTITPDLAK